MKAAIYARVSSQTTTEFTVDGDGAAKARKRKTA